MCLISKGLKAEFAFLPWPLLFGQSSSKNQDGLLILSVDAVISNLISEGLVPLFVARLDESSSKVTRAFPTSTEQ